MSKDSNTIVNWLCAAQSGDVKAAHELVRWFYQEMLALTVTSSLPLPALDHLRSLRSECREVSDFLDGFRAGIEYRTAQSQRRKTKRRRA